MQYARTSHLCWLIQETLNFVSPDPSDRCCMLPPLNGPQKNELMCAAGGQERTSNNYATCILHTEPSSRVSISGWYKTFKQRGCVCKGKVLIDLLCLMEMWTIFGLGSCAAYKNNCPDLSCKFQLP